jgi:hypothetical protein
MSTTQIVRTGSVDSTLSGKERAELVSDATPYRCISRRASSFPRRIARIRGTADETRLAHNIRCIWNRYIFRDQRLHHGAHELFTRAPTGSTD